MYSVEKQKEWTEDLAKVGLSKELFESILAASPEREIVPGYPQEKVVGIIIQQNW